MNLQLRLKRQWFEMTDPEVKTEDYRELTEYWIKRLCKTYIIYKGKLTVEFKTFTTNTMTLGYPSKTDTDRIKVFEHAGIEIRTGRQDWGAEPNKLYFVIKHGKRIQ